MWKQYGDAFVSDSGEIKLNGRFLNQYNCNGYKQVNINGKLIYVHRVVASAFIPNQENKPQVNHKDGDKSNNCASNLEWATASENQKHAFKTLLHPKVRCSICEKEFFICGSKIKSSKVICRECKEKEKRNETINKNKERYRCIFENADKTFLSDTEIKIMQLLISGKNSTEISELLNIERKRVRYTIKKCERENVEYKARRSVVHLGSENVSDYNCYMQKMYERHYKKEVV